MNLSCLLSTTEKKNCGGNWIPLYLCMPLYSPKSADRGRSVTLDRLHCWNTLAVLRPSQQCRRLMIPLGRCVWRASHMIGITVMASESQVGSQNCVLETQAGVLLVWTTYSVVKSYHCCCILYPSQVVNRWVSDCKRQVVQCGSLWQSLYT